MQIGEVLLVIYLHEFSWLNALWLDAKIYTVDAKLSKLFYIKFWSLDREQIFCYEIMKTCYVLMLKIKTNPHTHSWRNIVVITTP